MTEADKPLISVFPAGTYKITSTVFEGTTIWSKFIGIDPIPVRVQTFEFIDKN